MCLLVQDELQPLSQEVPQGNTTKFSIVAQETHLSTVFGIKPASGTFPVCWWHAFWPRAKRFLPISPQRGEAWKQPQSIGRAVILNTAPQPGGCMKPPHPTPGFRKEKTDVEGGHMGQGPAFLLVLIQSKLQQQDTKNILHALQHFDFRDNLDKPTQLLIWCTQATLDILHLSPEDPAAHPYLMSPTASPFASSSVILSPGLQKAGRGTRKDRGQSQLLGWQDKELKQAKQKLWKKSGYVINQILEGRKVRYIEESKSGTGCI